MMVVGAFRSAQLSKTRKFCNDFKSKARMMTLRKKIVAMMNKCLSNNNKRKALKKRTSKRVTQR